jgi:alanine or glycine:cation symporter, AGCS family
MTALAATVRTGNFAGVGTAIAVGGPGALFWMWVTGVGGMATKYAEAVLAVRYRITDARRQIAVGPIYYRSPRRRRPFR